MLDAGIWQEGEAKGVVCLESVGERREWTADEQQFAAARRLLQDLDAALDNERETLAGLVFGKYLGAGWQVHQATGMEQGVEVARLRPWPAQGTL